MLTTVWKHPGPEGSIIFATICMILVFVFVWRYVKDFTETTKVWSSTFISRSDMIPRGLDLNHWRLFTHHQTKRWNTDTLCIRFQGAESIQVSQHNLYFNIYKVQRTTFIVILIQNVTGLFFAFTSEVLWILDQPGKCFGEWTVHFSWNHSVVCCLPHHEYISTSPIKKVQK